MKVAANGIELEVEIGGDGEPLVMIMGIGAQLTLWPDGFVQQLQERGFRTIRFDNRDMGLSTWFDDRGAPDLKAIFARRLLGRPIEAPYTLSDMAADVAGLLDALELDSAHVIGASMGGMIGQTLAIEHPSRVRSLVSVMSGPGDLWSGLARPSALRALLGPAPRTEEEAGERAVRLFRVIGSPKWPLDEAALRDRARLSFRRAHHPVGFVRQMAAIQASGSRLPRLGEVRAPTLVIHGTHDPLIPPSAGKRTAAAIPGAELMLLEGMGHDLPEPLWPVLVDAIAAHARRRPVTVDPGAGEGAVEADLPGL